MVVKPPLRHVSMRLSARFTSSAALRHGVLPGRSSGPREISGLGWVLSAGVVDMPTSEDESIRPGYTVNPLPSIIHASSGIFVSRPTEAIMPREMTIVPFSIVGPDTGTILAPRIAKYGGSPPCPRRTGTIRKQPAIAEAISER